MEIVNINSELMEKWDAYDKNGKLIDKILIRGENIPSGMYHLVCEVIVKHKDGTYLCMQRSYDKKGYPGYYEVSAGGASLMGEDKFTCIKRELKEETGLDLKEILTISPMVYSSAGMTDEAISIAYVLVDGKVSDKFLEGSEDIKPFLADKTDLQFFFESDIINWGAKAWTIVYSILNPNPFNI